MNFKCTHTWEDGAEDVWEGSIDSIINYGNYFEIFITSRSSIHLIFGVYSRGLFAVSPYCGGTYLSNKLSDVFYNTEQLSKMLDNIVDGVTAATALLILSKKISLKI